MAHTSKIFISTLFVATIALLIMTNVAYALDEAGMISYGNCEGADGFVALECFIGSRKLEGAYYEKDLGPFMNKVFAGAIALGAILAVFRLAWAGFRYMSSDLPGMKGDAKEIISETLLGLFLLLGIWLILYQINPDILKLKVNFESVSPSANYPNDPGGLNPLPSSASSKTAPASGKAAPTTTMVPSPDNIHCASRVAGGFGSVDCFADKESCNRGIDVLPNFVRGSCKDVGPPRWYGSDTVRATQEAARIQNLTSGERDAELRRIQTTGMAEDERIKNLPNEEIEQFPNN